MKKTVTAAMLAALTVGVTVITGLGASWNTTSAGETVRKAVHALRYENEAQAMPEGDFSTGVDFSDTPMLDVTLSRPESLYLRGFIGQRYTRQNNHGRRNKQRYGFFYKHHNILLKYHNYQPEQYKK